MPAEQPMPVEQPKPAEGAKPEQSNDKKPEIKLKEGKIENKRKKISLFDTLSNLTKQKNKNDIDEKPEKFDKSDVQKVEPKPEPEKNSNLKKPIASDGKKEENKAENLEDGSNANYILSCRLAETSELGKAEDVSILVRK